MDVYSALAEPTRRRIIEMLAGAGELPASAIYDEFSVSHPAISQHLKVLREANLVKIEKRAQQRLYSINPEPMREMDDWIRQMTQLWNERFDRLDILLREEKTRLRQSYGGQEKKKLRNKEQRTKKK